MYCTQCGKENQDDTNYCVHCGKEISSPVIQDSGNLDNDTAQDTNQEYLVEAITNIKHAGVATLSYWTIIFSNRAVYFCYMGGNALPGGYGAFADVILSHKAKVKNQNLAQILEKAEKYHKIEGVSLKNLEYKKGMLGGHIIFPRDGEKNLKLKVSGKQYEKFIKNLAALVE